MKLKDSEISMIANALVDHFGDIYEEAAGHGLYPDSEDTAKIQALALARLSGKPTSPDKIVVTRHKGLVQLLIKRGIIAEGTPVIEHATVDTVRDKHVIGVLPLSLAVHAAKVTEIVMTLPLELRGKDLSLAECEQYAGEAITYEINRV
jgi:hypothetical protein